MKFVKVKPIIIEHLQIRMLLEQVLVKLNLHHQIDLLIVKSTVSHHRINCSIATVAITARHLRTSLFTATVAIIIAWCFQQINCFVVAKVAIIIKHRQIMCQFILGFVIDLHRINWILLISIL